MADTKITALTAISTVDPAIDVLPIVDVSDTTMAASGTTKKITSNQILGAGGTATLASATITGDLTVDTNVLKVDSANNRVGIGTATPSDTLSIIGGNASNLLIDNGGEQYTQLTLQRNSVLNSGGDILINGTASTMNIRMLAVGSMKLYTSPTAGSPAERYSIDSTGISTWSVAGSTAMTLNSTGLGVGVTPGSGLGNIQAGGSANASLYVQQGTDTVRMGMRATGRTGILLDSSDATYTNRAWYLDNVGSTGSLIIGRQGLDVVTFSNTGNVGVGVTPTTIVGASGVNGKGLQGDSWTISSLQGTNESYFANNLYSSAYNVWSNRYNAVSGAYYLTGGTHIFLRGAAQAPGVITPIESARIDANGNLILQPSSTPPSLFANGQLTVNATSNTNLRFSYRGSDGTTRVANLTLA